jgi:hypothetical protein
VLGSAVEAPLWALEVEAELRGDHDLVANRGERVADELLVGERPICLRGVEKRDTTVYRCPEQVDNRVLVRSGAVDGAHRHAAEADRRDLEVVRTGPACLHLRLAT